jgi:hypothetical protein
MTEEQWLVSEQTSFLVRGLRGKTTERKRVLFGAGCCRVLYHGFLARYKEIEGRVLTVERYADGQASEAEYRQATWAWIWKLGDLIRPGENSPPPDPEALVGNAALAWLCGPWARVASSDSPEAVPVLRDIFNPFGPTLDPLWLVWEGGMVSNLARGIYEERAWDRLPVLSDALEEAGGTDADILSHLRSPGPHVRGCWAVDLVLGKH